MDFYSICAHHWGIPQEDASSQIIVWYFTKYTQDMNDSMRINAPLLDFIHRDARAEVLKQQGIELGDL